MFLCTAIWPAAKKSGLCERTHTQISRCTQQPLSVKYLFGEANVVYDFLLLEGDQTVDDRSIHLQFFPPRVRPFFLEKRKPKM